MLPLLVSLLIPQSAPAVTSTGVNVKALFWSPSRGKALGIADDGGAFGQGTIFRVDRRASPSGGKTLDIVPIHSFPRSAQDYRPISALEHEGTVYGACADLGREERGTFWTLTGTAWRSIPAPGTPVAVLMGETVACTG